MSRPMKNSPDEAPSLTGPTSLVMPYSVTILRAMLVAFSMSFEAPVVGSWKTISSATRPTMAYVKLVLQLVAGHGVLVVERQHHRVAQRPCRAAGSTFVTGSV